MLGNASSDPCSGNALIELSESRDVLWGPVIGAAVSGATLALIVTALIICACSRKQRAISGDALWGSRCPNTRPGASWCLRSHEEEEKEEEESDGDSRSCAPDERVPVSSDVAAFALRARVVYPISQRYRPLADGASNPSLHEPPKCPAPPSQDSASSLADDWLSQERDDDDESSQFVSCGPSSKTHASYVFRRVQHYPQSPCHSRVALLCLALEELQRHTSRLQQEKLSMFLHILRVLLDEREHADIIQEAELLMRGGSLEDGVESGVVTCSVEEAELLTRGGSLEEGVESGVVTCSVEEVERAGQEQLQRSLQTAVSFAKQLQRLGQNLQLRLSSDVSEKVMRGIMGCLRAMEEVLAEVQASVLQMLVDRIECWQEVSDGLRGRTALLKLEAELMLKLTGQSMEQLSCDGQLEILRDFQTAVNEAVEQSTDAVRRQTELLALEHVRKSSERKRRMMKNQSCEWRHVSDTHTDIHPMMKVFVELQVRQWRERREFECEQDRINTESLCQRWTSSFAQSRRRLADLWEEFVLSVAADSAPSADLSQSGLKSLKLTLTNHMQREESHAHTHLRRLREQLQRRRQVWVEDEALTRSRLDHFAEQQHAVAVAMVSRLSDMQMSCALMEEQQHLLIRNIHRILESHCFHLRLMREMKLSAQTEQQDSCVAVETVCSEEAVIGQNLLHEQLSELEAAAELLQGHAHFLFGHALAGATRVKVRDGRVKERLMDAARESVHVTRRSLHTLIREYYCDIQTSLTPHTSAAEHTNTQRERMDCIRALHTQLTNWSRKPSSTELHHRVVELKRKCVTEFQKDLQSSVETHNKLREEEQAFMCRLASLARVSLGSLNQDDVTGTQHTQQTNT